MGGYGLYVWALMPLCSLGCCWSPCSNGVHQRAVSQSLEETE